MPIVNTNTNSIPPKNYVLAKKERDYNNWNYLAGRRNRTPGQIRYKLPRARKERSNVLTANKDNYIYHFHFWPFIESKWPEN